MFFPTFQHRISTAARPRPRAASAATRPRSTQGGPRTAPQRSTSPASGSDPGPDGTGGERRQKWDSRRFMMGLNETWDLGLKWDEDFISGIF